MKKKILVISLSIFFILTINYINNVGNGNFLKGLKYTLKSPQKNIRDNINLLGKYFLKFEFKKTQSQTKNIGQYNFEIEKFKNPYIDNMGPRGYLKFNKEHLFLISGNGFLMISRIEKKLKNKLIFKPIKTNITTLSGYSLENHSNFVNGFLIKDNKFFVSIIKSDKNDCLKNSVLISDLNLKKMIFEELFVNDYCGLFGQNRGGYIADYKKNKILMSIGDFDSYLRDENSPQETKNLLGKIITIDIKTGESSIISMGHRNIQGIFYDKDYDVVFSAEHGPQGGDEINLNINPGKEIKNYGWAISSYGEHYGYPDIDPDVYITAPLNKSHKDFGFIEPLRYFTPSIAPTAIIKNEKILNLKNSHAIYLSTLGWFKDGEEPKNIYDNSSGKQSIHQILLDENYKIIDYNILPVGERMRDLTYIEKINKIAVFLETSGELMFLKISKN